MKERKIAYIDASKMTEKELCEALKIEYVPWYRSSLFWGLIICSTIPSIILLIEVLK